ncbi:uncharacterized protein LOC125030354 [Penaeus chinensis]|uniref:uncharacterized protein LOC125030354 n=1 Tax=Penaeus chinensis TaxID=139456 RepID=UPI001FB6748F|nr:uncharacterized protein LOC125030354 [Penaeus chinensis]
MACSRPAVCYLLLGLWNACWSLQIDNKTNSFPRNLEIRSVRRSDSDSFLSEVFIRSLSGGSPPPTATNVTLKTSLPSCRHHAVTSFTHASVNASVTWSCGDLTVPGHLRGQVNTRVEGEGLRLVADLARKNVVVTSSGVKLVFSGGYLNEPTSWLLRAQSRIKTEQACRRSHNDGPPQEDSSLLGEPAGQTDSQCTPTFTEPNELYHGHGPDEIHTKQPEHFEGVEFETQLSKGEISVMSRSLSGERRLLIYTSSTEGSGATKWMLHLPNLNLRLNASSTSWRDHLNDHSYFEAEMTNLITKANIKITSKEVLVRQRDNLDDTEKQVQEGNEGKEAVRSHPPKTMEGGSEEDLVPDSNSQENIRRTKRHLDEGQVGTDFQESEASSGGSDLAGLFLPANCIPGSKLVKHVKQTVASSIFNLETTMTVDATPDGENIISILQKTSLPVCPDFDSVLKQIFNFSSSFTGWEYVVCQWSWGSMVVEAQWGVSFFQYYHKIFAFNTDQNSPLPSIHFLLDFRDYKEFQVKAKCPTLGKSLVFTLHTDANHHTFMVRNVNEFMPLDSSTLIKVDVEVIRNDLAVTWYFDEENTVSIWSRVTEVVLEAISSTSFCGQNANKEMVKTFISDMFGDTRLQLMPEVWAFLTLVREVEELQDLKSFFQETNQDVFDFSSLWSNLLASGYKMGILEAHPQGMGVTVKTQGIIWAFSSAMEAWKVVSGCSNNCDTTHQLSRLVEDFVASIRHS